MDGNFIVDIIDDTAKSFAKWIMIIGLLLVVLVSYITVDVLSCNKPKTYEVRVGKSIIKAKDKQSRAYSKGDSVCIVVKDSTQNTWYIAEDDVWVDTMTAHETYRLGTIK